MRATLCNGPGGWIGHQFAQRVVEHGAGSAKGNVTDVLAPDQLIDILKRLCVKAGFLPDPGNALQSLAHPTIHLADTDQVHCIMMHVAGSFHRSTETVGYAEQHAISSHILRNSLTGAKAVLDRNHYRLWPH